MTNPKPATSPQPVEQTPPDTATTYERADPAQQSPDGKLTQPPARKDENADNLQQNQAPARQRPAPEAPPKASTKREL